MGLISKIAFSAGALFAVLSTNAVAADVLIQSFEDNNCLGPIIANVTTSYNQCASVNGMGMVQVNAPASLEAGAKCAFMTGYGDSNCTVAVGNMFALNSQCGACQAATYGVTCLFPPPGSSASPTLNIATYCVDDQCQDCNGRTAVKEHQCTWVQDLGYVIVDAIKPCSPISYTLYYSASYCDDQESQILPFEVPSGQCNSGLKLTLL